MGFSDPAIQGTNITFTCPPGLVLTGPDTSTCMGNGEWEPDLWNLRSKGKLAYCQSHSILHTLHSHSSKLVSYMSLENTNFGGVFAHFLMHVHVAGLGPRTVSF